MMRLDSLRVEVRRYLTTLVERGSTLDDRTDLFASGAVKSMQVLELVNHLEDHYGLLVSQRDLFGGRLRSVDAIVELVLEQRMKKAS